MAKVRFRTGGHTETIYHQGKKEKAHKFLNKKNRYQRVVLGEESGMQVSNRGLWVSGISWFGCILLGGFLVGWDSDSIIGYCSCCLGFILPQIPVLYFHFRHEMCVEKRVFIPTFSEGETNRRGWWKW